MIYFLLNLIASLIKWLLQPLCYTWGIFASIKNKEFSLWHLQLSLAKDKWGNVLIKYPANFLLIKKNGYKFGYHTETISKVLGKNKMHNTLTILGKCICYVLNKLDKNHVENAAKK